jgi:hypothetical protein
METARDHGHLQLTVLPCDTIANGDSIGLQRCAPYLSGTQEWTWRNRLEQGRREDQLSSPFPEAVSRKCFLTRTFS